jgi:hypothetical protein
VNVQAGRVIGQHPDAPDLDTANGLRWKRTIEYHGAANGLVCGWFIAHGFSLGRGMISQGRGRPHRVAAVALVLTEPEG